VFENELQKSKSFFPDFKELFENPNPILHYANKTIFVKLIKFS
jgi:hypothetical protein